MQTAKPAHPLHRVENLISCVLLGLIAAIPTLEVLARKILRTGIHSSSQYVQHLILFS